MLDNQARYPGGALYVAGGGFATGESSTFSANPAGNGGGGIDSEQQLFVSASLFVGNQGGTSGGSGIYLGSGDDIVNSTFSGNVSADGPAIILASNGDARLDALTVADNVSHAAMPAGVMDYFAGNTVVKNLLFAANTPANCGLAPTPYTTLAGPNLSSEASCAGFTRENTNPLLGPLAANGGSTQTQALLAGSPALDLAIDCTGPDGGTPLATDQRGYRRPFGSACDLGAFEFDDTIFADGFDVAY